MLWPGARPLGAEQASLSLASFPPAGRFEYRILRVGEEIGRHEVEFRRDRGRLVVETRMEAVVTLLSIPVFRFRHAAQEKWVDDSLESLTAQTDDDGTERSVEAEAEGGRLRVVYNGKPREYEGPMIPASLWHPATVEQTVLFDPIRGRPRRIAVAAHGREEVDLGPERRMAMHYSITGELKRELWYGLDRQILQVTFPAKDGSIVTILRRG